MKILEIVNSIESFNKLLEQKLPAKTSYKIARLVVALNPEVDTYSKTRDAKLKEFGTPVLDEEGKVTDKFSFEGENKTKFIEEMTAVENTELKLDIPEITIDDLGDINIEPKYLSALTWLIK